jgi:hypothetical protein
MPTYRTFAPGGATWTDADILDPATDIPGYMRPFRATSTQVLFDVYGKASTAVGATEVTVGAMTIDAFVAWESGSVRAPGTSPPGTERPSLRRGETILEAAGAVAPGVTRIIAEAEKGATGYLRLDLAAIAAPALEVVLVRGGRPL